MFVFPAGMGDDHHGGDEAQRARARLAISRDDPLSISDPHGSDIDRARSIGVQEGAPIYKQSRRESPEPSVLELCNFWRLLVVGGVPGPATRPFHLLRQPRSVLADGRKLGVSRKGPFGVWGCSRPPEMLRTPGLLHWVDCGMCPDVRDSKKQQL